MEDFLISHIFYLFFIFGILTFVLILRIVALSNSDDLRQDYQSKDIALLLDVLQRAPSTTKLTYSYPLTPGFSYSIRGNSVQVGSHIASAAQEDTSSFVVQEKGGSLLITHAPTS